jgi:hypothetical protein
VLVSESCDELWQGPSRDRAGTGHQASKHRFSCAAADDLAMTVS